jgi:hypothetical protein
VTAPDVWSITMTPELAAEVRRYRVDQELSWRGVAAAVSEAHCDEKSDNQIAGRELCVIAAALLGENPNADPWN